MADFAPPAGPPPPKVPEGWLAQWNDQYKEWFYVNKYTKKSQWDRPTEPIYPPPEGGADAPPGPPPLYNHADSNPMGHEKGVLGSNNPYSHSASGSHHDLSEDERLARQLQQEENARAHTPGGSSRGQADSYYNQGPGASPQPGYGQQDLPPRPEEQSRGGGKKGFLGKLLGKASGSSKPSYGGYGQPQGGYPQQQPQYYQGPPQGQYGYQPQQGYYGQGGYAPGPGYGPPGGGYGGYAQQQQPKKSGMGAGGAAALGLGGGLVGGMLLENAIDDHDQNEYDQGFQNGQDNNDYGGGGDDFGGGGDDFGGGDF